MSKIRNGSAVPRHFVFIMADGAFVVQLSENRVQELLTGQYRPLDDRSFGHTITDYELNQLKAAGLVEDYNRNYVWLYRLPEPHHYDPAVKTQERIRNRIRTYYINTMLPKSQLDIVRALLTAVGMSEEVTPDSHGDQVVISGRNGIAFSQLKDAEDVQKQLVAKANNLFKNSAVAFTETTLREDLMNQEVRGDDNNNADLATIIASQMDTSVTTNKEVVLLVNVPEERNAIMELCRDMKMIVHVAKSGAEGLLLLEDGHSDLLIMDLQLVDMHGWEVLGKVKEIESLRNLVTIVLAEHSMSNQQSLALTVAKVDVYLVKPVSKARLRQNIWMALKNHTLS
jgi:CheY-like chemotaxis protein